jgi:hypothetical protein
MNNKYRDQKRLNNVQSISESRDHPSRGLQLTPIKVPQDAANRMVGRQPERH